MTKTLEEKKEAKRKYSMTYRLSHREELRRKSLDYYYNNRDKAKEYYRKYFQEHKEEYRLRGVEFRAKNPDKNKAYGKKYYQKKKEIRLRQLEDQTWKKAAE